MAKFILGATEKIKRDDSVPVELLPSNKLLYAAKLNSEEDADMTPVRCNKMCLKSSAHRSMWKWSRSMASRSTLILKSKL